MNFQIRWVPGSSELWLRCCHSALDRNKPSVLIALPFGLPAEVSAAAFARLEQKYNVVTWESRYILNLDLEFSGDEELEPGAQVQDMLVILRALEIDRCCLIGYCSGAGIALLAARHHSEIFPELILVNGEYQLFRNGYKATIYQRSIDTFLPVVASSRTETQSIFSTLAEVSRTGRGDGSSELHRQINTPFSSEEILFRYARTYMAYRDFNALGLAAEIRQCPFVVTGRLDEHSSMTHSRAIGAALSGSKLFVDDSGDHYAFCRGGSPTLEAIGAYLGT